MNREMWEFPYTADKLLEAATVKRDHHLGRLKWWEDKKAEVIETVKAEGIQVDESVAAEFSNSKSYGRGGNVQVRNDLVLDLNECVQKIVGHRAKAADYAGWVEVLASQGQASFALHQEDWLFFFDKS